MPLDQSIFRAYDIRGIYPQDLNGKTAYQIGRAFAVYLKENETEAPEKIAVGRDARLSSPAICNSFISGVVDEGISVWDVGLVTVDVIYFASGYFKVPSVMVTASHNPKEWNGFKMMKSGVKFFNIKDLLAIIDSGISKKEILKKGEVIKKDIKDDYKEHVFSFINLELIRPMRVAIDASNGAVGPMLKPILKKLPLQYTAIFFNPDGDFPNHGPDPTDEKNLADLKNEITAGHYHFGCAFDGDGDRIIFVDENGELVSSSVIAALMSRYFLSKNRGASRAGEKIVYSATIGRIVPEIIRVYNGEAMREKVGHMFISRHLREVNGIFGVEKSGHYFFRNNFYADSGIISFLVMLSILSSEKKSLSVLAKEFSKYVSTPEMNFKVKNLENLIKKIAQNFEGYETDWFDGLTIKTSDFWINLRPSNNEPLVRLNIEADNELVLNRVKKELIYLIKQYSL